MLRTGIRALFLLGIAGMVVSCANKVGPAEAYKGESSQQIFTAGEADMSKGDYSEAIKRFEALDVQYPLEREAEVAEIHLIYAYYRKEEYASAEAAAGRFIRVHPMSQYTDYAYLLQGLSEYYQNQGVLDRLFAVDLAKRDLALAKKAYADFSSIVERFPESPYAPAAYQYMIYFRNLLARHQLQVAEFYYEHRAYVAAADRASVVIKHYQGAPVVPDALVVMAKSYRELHLPQQQEEMIQLLQYNYPDSSYVREAR